MLYMQIWSSGDFFQNPTDQPWGVRTAYFKYPDGHLWEIAQPIQQSPGAPSAGARHTSAPAPGSTSGCAASRSGSPRTAPLSSTRSRPHQNGTNPRRDQRSAWPGQLSRTQPGVSPPPSSRRGQIRVLHRNRKPALDGAKSGENSGAISECHGHTCVATFEMCGAATTSAAHAHRRAHSRVHCWQCRRLERDRGGTSTNVGRRWRTIPRSQAQDDPGMRAHRLGIGTKRPIGGAVPHPVPEHACTAGHRRSVRRRVQAR